MPVSTFLRQHRFILIKWTTRTMNNEHNRRDSDYGTLPKPLAWTLIAIEKVGISAVVIAALFYVCFVSLANLRTAIESNTVKMVDVISANTNALNLLKREIKRKTDD